jgi:hypothetical protein
MSFAQLGSEAKTTPLAWEIRPHWSRSVTDRWFLHTAFIARSVTTEPRRARFLSMRGPLQLMLGDALSNRLVVFCDEDHRRTTGGDLHGVGHCSLAAW